MLYFYFSFCDSYTSLLNLRWSSFQLVAQKNTNVLPLSYVLPSSWVIHKTLKYRELKAQSIHSSEQNDMLLFVMFWCVHNNDYGSVYHVIHVRLGLLVHLEIFMRMHIHTRLSLTLKLTCQRKQSEFEWVVLSQLENSLDTFLSNHDQSLRTLIKYVCVCIYAYLTSCWDLTSCFLPVDDPDESYSDWISRYCLL